MKPVEESGIKLRRIADLPDLVTTMFGPQQ